MLNLKVVTWALGISTAFSFVFCVAYGLATPKVAHACVPRAGLARLQVAERWSTFVIGLVESFLYGVTRASSTSRS